MFEPKQNNVSPKTNICIDTLTFFVYKTGAFVSYSHTDTHWHVRKMEKQSKNYCYFFVLRFTLYSADKHYFSITSDTNLFWTWFTKKNLDVYRYVHVRTCTDTNCGSKIIIDMSSKILSSQFHSLLQSRCIYETQIFPSVLPIVLLNTTNEGILFSSCLDNSCTSFFSRVNTFK